MLVMCNGVGEEIDFNGEYVVCGKSDDGAGSARAIYEARLWKGLCKVRR